MIFLILEQTQLTTGDELHSVLRFNDKIISDKKLLTLVTKITKPTGASTSSSISTKWWESWLFLLLEYDWGPTIVVVVAGGVGGVVRGAVNRHREKARGCSVISQSGLAKIGMCEVRSYLWPLRPSEVLSRGCRWNNRPVTVFGPRWTASNVEKITRQLIV